MAEVDMLRSFIHRCESLISELGLKLYKIGSFNTDIGLSIIDMGL